MLHGMPKINFKQSINRMSYCRFLNDRIDLIKKWPIPWPFI